MRFWWWTISAVCSKLYLQQCFLWVGLVRGRKYKEQGMGSKTTLTWDCAQTSEGEGNMTAWERWYTLITHAAEFLGFVKALLRTHSMSSQCRNNAMMRMTGLKLSSSVQHPSLLLPSLMVSSQGACSLSYATMKAQSTPNSCIAKNSFDPGHSSSVLCCKRF